MIRVRRLDLKGHLFRRGPVLRPSFLNSQVNNLLTRLLSLLKFDVARPSYALYNRGGVAWGGIDGGSLGFELALETGETSLDRAKVGIPLPLRNEIEEAPGIESSKRPKPLHQTKNLLAIRLKPPHERESPDRVENLKSETKCHG